jgi:hypothetical protein
LHIVELKGILDFVQEVEAMTIDNLKYWTRSNIDKNGNRKSECLCWLSSHWREEIKSLWVPSNLTTLLYFFDVPNKLLSPLLSSFSLNHSKQKQA